MSTVECISFQNGRGHRLHGILHQPDASSARGVCVLLLSPGIKGRVGPHRLYLKIAARLVPLGFHVLRFDFYGLGDSEGELTERKLVEVYNAIQAGRYVDDTIVAMDWMKATYGVQRFVGSGLCGGSLTALLAAERDRRIECILGLGLPTTLDGGRENWGRHLTQGQLAEVRLGYLRKLGSVGAWTRFLRGKSEYSVIWKTIRGGLRPRHHPPPAVAAIAPDSSDNTNPLFAPAFRAVAESRRPLVLVFGGNDRLQFEFSEKFEARNSEWIRARRPPYVVRLIPDANHVLSDGPWVKAMLDFAEPWLSDQCRA
jgi:pimeloyl-ACP methyl ester carboxylesterase